MSDKILWELWIPGQCPGGKNNVARRWDPRTKKMRIMPRRRKNAAGEWGRTPFERWFWSVEEHLYWRRLEAEIKPVSSPTRLAVNYFWGDRHNRDEPGRMDALASLLEGTGWVEDDKHLRQVWSYRGWFKTEPGLYLVAVEEERTEEFFMFHCGRRGGAPSEILGLNPARVTVRMGKGSGFAVASVPGKKGLIESKGEQS